MQTVLQKLLVVVLMLASGYIYSQINDTVPFKTILSIGKMPEDFVTSKGQKVKDILQKDAESSKQEDKKTLENFVTTSTYGISDFLNSGYVTYNDPMSDYFKKVAAETFKNQDDLANKIRIYTYKSAAVNAFTTGDGIIFITLGLMAQLENEAQLAYILCHEVVHYLNKHGFEQYKEFEKIKKGVDAYRDLDRVDRIYAKSYFSKEHEFSADEEGLEFFMETNYDISTLNRVFDVLQYSYLPFDIDTFDASFIETPFMKISTDWKLEEIKEISNNENYDDSKSTHPNILKRRKAINKLLKEQTIDPNKKQFIVSKSDFLKLQEQARFELTRQHLRNLDYAEAIYNNFLLSLKYPADDYVEYSTAYALYAAAKYKNDKEWNDVSVSYKDIEGPSQQLHYIIRKMSAEHISTLAVEKCYTYYKKHPDDKVAKNVAKDAFNELIYEHDKSLVDYVKWEPAKGKGNDSTDAEGSTVGLSKYDKIKKSQSKSPDDEDSDEESDLKYAFSDLLNDPDFVEMFEEREEAMAKYLKIKNNKETADEKSKRLAENADKKKIEKKHGKSLGVNKIVLVDPYFWAIDQTNDNSMKYEKSEEKRQEYIQNIKIAAEAAGLDVQIIDPYGLSDSETEIMNDYSLIREWMKERFIHKNQNLYPSTTHEIEYLKEKYGTSFFAFTGFIQLKEVNANQYYTACCYAAMVVTLPLAIYTLLKGNIISEYNFVLCDITDGEAMLVQSNNFNQAGSKTLLKSQLYNSFYQIVKKKKEKK